MKPEEIALAENIIRRCLESLANPKPPKEPWVDVSVRMDADNSPRDGALCEVLVLGRIIEKGPWSSEHQNWDTCYDDEFALKFIRREDRGYGAAARKGPVTKWRYLR